MRRLIVTLAALSVALGVLCGCGDDTQKESAAAPQTVTVIETQTAAATTVAPASTPAPVAKPATTSAAPPTRSASGIVVPDVVGKNHQYAQDTMQAAGLYNLSEEDATGQGRLLLWDRNWVVVSQRPAGGTRVPEDTTIVLSSKKYGE